MRGFLPFLTLIAVYAFLPLVYATVRTASRAKMKDGKFVVALAKDYLRTLPIVGLVSLPALLFPTTVRPYVIALHLVFALPLLLELGHVHLYGTRVGLNTFYSVFVSNVRETREFLKQNVSWIQGLLVVVVWLVPPFALARLPVPAWGSRTAQAIGCGAAALGALAFVRNLLRGDHGKDGYTLNPFSNLIVNYFRFRILYRKLREQIACHAAPPFEGITSSLPADERKTYVIVIGESANAQHHHYCGYPRETNEFTDRLGDSVLRFRGVRSPFAQTIPVLERVLTFADAAHPELVWQKGSVVDYFHEAGFKTYWMSNQYALDDTAITAMTSHADVNKCYNFGGMKRFEKAGLDGDLLPDFGKFVRDEGRNKVLFLHLIGSHAAYANRYPDSFRHFDGQVPGRNLPPTKLAAVNAYDDSIRYTDWVVAELIRELDSVGGVAYLLYFSDHGEDIYDSTEARILGHGPLANEPMTSVPFMLWTSSRLDELRGDIRARFREAQRSYGLGDVIHTILDVSSLSNGDCRLSRSILNPAGKD